MRAVSGAQRPILARIDLDGERLRTSTPSSGWPPVTIPDLRKRPPPDRRRAKDVRVPRAHGRTDRPDPAGLPRHRVPTLVTSAERSQPRSTTSSPFAVNGARWRSGRSTVQSRTGAEAPRPTGNPAVDRFRLAGNVRRRRTGVVAQACPVTNVAFVVWLLRNPLGPAQPRGPAWARTTALRRWTGRAEIPTGWMVSGIDATY